MQNKTAKIAFIGLGVMGYPMAGHLARAGYGVCVYNRTTSKAAAWVEEYQGTYANTPAEAAQDADLVFICVGNDEDVRQVTLGTEGVLSTLGAGGVLIDHSTVSAQLAQELAVACSEQGLDFIDAPVSGGQQGAQNGVLTIMCGAETSAFERVQSVMQTYARAVTLMGPAGSGQLTKMVNQICIAGLVQGLAEGLHFAQHAGLDAHKVMQVISQGAAGSWQMQNRHATMIASEYEHGFAVDWMRKDLNICLQAARQLDIALPVTALVDQFYAEVQNIGGGRWDTSSLLKRLQHLQTPQKS
ncbi:3-hydroxyisobutyrate dehydrogenase [Allopseudospirillum japonicum]|uniref:3-hydroxyisobutyrate dehydrogenase n=1 Tax=Allopseudospirillum japonicum TaxID=64971 RepID=A0A1H6QCD9_9GAMM|nr:NAD(P)-dependent oxidoreductase [Allopseudospirillum japonicum]SEI41361.1 3-hydroxyisobutyrate dehydrogenase [Allopseudospirillum japonicum]